MQRLAYFVASALLVCWLPTAAATLRTATGGPEPGDVFRKGDRPPGGGQKQVRVEVVFAERDRQLIRSYYGGGGQGLPPGLAKRGGHLPPGLEKHLARNGTLPPGLQKRVVPFPPELERRLPPLPSGCSRVILEGRAIILGRGGRILDLFYLHQ